jgi:hypothetical protein
MDCHFRILEVGLTLSGPAEVVEPIAFAYRRFAVETPARTDSVDLRICLGESGDLTVNGRAVPLVPGVPPGDQLFHRAHTALMDSIGSVAMLHAAAVTDERGGALVLGGPSGHGKSSLALELVRRGHGFLSDEIAPLDLARSRVSPFPRAVALVPRAGFSIPEPFLTESRKPSAVRWFGKVLLDVGRILGDSALIAEPAPLRHVILLVSGDDPFPVTTVVELATMIEDASELDPLFRGTDGVEILARRATESLCGWKLRLDHTRNPTETLSPVFESDRVVLFEKRWEGRPDFSGPAMASPLRRREAAEMLGRDMLNRRSAGRLMARYEGSAARLLVDLAGALRDASCWSIRVGSDPETADLVEQLLQHAEEHEPIAGKSP